MTEFTQAGIERLREIMNDGGEYFSRALALEALDEIERLQKENKELKEFVDATRPTGICEICTSNVISRYEPLQARVQELEQERRWIPVSEWEQKEGVDMLLRVVVRGLKRTFTGYLKDGEFKIPLDWANSIPVTWNLVTHVMELPQPPKDGE